MLALLKKKNVLCVQCVCVKRIHSTVEEIFFLLARQFLADIQDEERKKKKKSFEVFLSLSRIFFHTQIETVEGK
jgi:hypothetical protein